MARKISAKGKPPKKRAAAAAELSPHGYRWLVECLALVAFVTVVAWWHPAIPRASDEANYIATAFKIGRDFKLTAATHHYLDILEHGTDHKPVKMPAYLVALAVWLKVFPNPDHVRWLNLLLFGAAVLLMLRLVVTRRDGYFARNVVAGFVLLSAPLGLAYAKTAMMESFVLLVVTLHFGSWFRPGHERTKLLAFFLTGFLAVTTKEVLALLSFAIVLVYARDFYRMYVDLYRRGKLIFTVHILLPVALAASAIWLYQDRGYFPSFRNRLAEADDWATVAKMVADNFTANFGMFTHWSSFPHDYLYGYALAMCAACAVLAVATRGGPAMRLNLTLFVAWSLNILLICAFYDNWDWRSHRIFFVYAWLTSAAIVWQWSQASASTTAWTGSIAVLLAVQVFLCLMVDRRFIFHRTPSPQERHVLTRLGIARQGDCLLSPFDFQFLVENARCELIWMLPQPGAELNAVVRRARPRFIILPAQVDMTDLSYRRMAIVRRGQPSAYWQVWVHDDLGSG